MKAKHKVILATLLILGSIALCIFFLSTHNVAVLNPKGFISYKQRHLYFIASLLMLIVVIPVFVMTIYFAVKYRETNKDATYSPDWEDSSVAEAVWWGVPFVIIVVLAIITYKSSHELNPFKPLVSETKPLTVQVVALQWKWLFIFPEQKIATINYLQIPEKTPINFVITADAPMNSFWIPQLGGMIYAMPSMRSKLHLMANEPGTYRGCSAHISGTGFAGMTFDVKACSNSEFEQWVSSTKSKGHSLNLDSYNKLIPPSSYDPVTYYHLQDEYLFEQILEKYSGRGAQ